MGKDKETKKLDAEELEKRAAPFTAITEETDGGEETSGGGSGKPDSPGGGGGHTKYDRVK